MEWRSQYRDQIDFSKYSLMDKLRVGVLASVGHLVPMPVLFKLQRLAAAKDRKKKTKTLVLQQLPAGLSLCNAGGRMVRARGGSAV